MQAESVTHCPADYPLCITAKRYWLPQPNSNVSSRPDALTLIFLHATSFHKETWEPSLERLLNLCANPQSPIEVREAWALDCPNHGEAGHLNEPKLNLPEFRNNYTCEKYAQSAHRFLSARPNGVDFRKRNLIGIGHSLGGNSMLILQHLEPIVPFDSIIIVEPLISPAGPKFLTKLRTTLVKGAYERRDVWPDRHQALEALKKRERTKKWDPRIIDLFVEFALMPHPGGTSPETPYLGVTLACSRDQEAAMYRDSDGPTLPVKDLNKACANLPVHLILGAVNDFMPARVHAAIIDPQSGRKYASVTRIGGVGHLIPQEAPDQLGEVMYEVLASSAGGTFKSKL